MVEQHGKNGNVGVFFIKGFSLRRGALAYSMSHNHQNICVLGVSDEDMALAVEELRRMKSRLATVIDGQVTASIPLTIGGLISEEAEAKVIVSQPARMNRSAELTGYTLPAPFMTISFIAHPAVPLAGSHRPGDGRCSPPGLSLSDHRMIFPQKSRTGAAF